jgi:trehalose/maltose transport system permease protein
MKNRASFYLLVKYCFPAILVILLILVFPLLSTVYYSLTDTRLSTLDEHHWVGFENFIYLLQDPDWWRALKNTVLFAVVSVALETLIGLLFALVLQSKFQGVGILRAAVLVPWAIPSVVSAKMWAWMFNDLFGVINEILIHMHLIDERLAWLADPNLTLATLVTVDVWKSTPFMALLLLAGLQGIPKNILEASTLDGASSFKKLIHITLPLIQPALWVAVIFRTLDALRIFDLPYILTSNSKSTATLSTYVRQQLIDFQEIGYGSAASILTFSVIGLFSLVYIGLSRKSLGLDS